MEFPAELDDLHIFVTVVSAGSLTAAARRLGSPKSTVSRRLSTLEEKLGVRLLERTTRKLRLTIEGKWLYDSVATKIADLIETQRKLTDRSETAEGRLRISAPVDLSQGRFSKLLSEYCAQYPDVQVEVILSQEKVDLISEDFDLAIRAGILKDSSMIAKRIAKVRLGFYASAEYLKRFGTPQSLESLGEHRLLAHTHFNRIKLQLSKGSSKSAFEFQARFSSNDFRLLQTMAIKCDGIVFMPDWMAEESMKLIPVLPEYSLDGQGLYVVYPDGKHLSKRARAFVDMSVKLGAVV